MTTTQKTTKYHEAVGRRKRATARVRITESSAQKIEVNERDFQKYFPTDELRKSVTDVFSTAGLSTLFSVKVHTRGGGVAAQADAIRHGIARALIKYKEDLRLILKKEGYLTRDARKKERKKFGLRKARRAPQWSKR